MKFPFRRKVLAYVTRFINNCRKKQIDKNVTDVRSIVKDDVNLDVVELDQSFNLTVRMVQCSFFSSEIGSLKQSKAVKACSKLLPLTPFLDDYGVLRVGGRLTHSSLSLFRKHPIILPAKAHFTGLFLCWIHDRYFHANQRFILDYLSSRFWIVGGALISVKAVVCDYARCAQFCGVVRSQLMGQLP